MTSSAAPARRLVLVPSADSRRTSSSDARLRRYRLARVTLDGRAPRRDKHSHLRRMHD